LTNTQGWTAPQVGYLISFITCSGIITYFTTILTGELRHREHAVQDAAAAKSRNQQLESLATLAGGAAHELATPLSTIAVVSKELSRNLERQSAPSGVLSDVALIRSELNRCREILDRMTAATGQAAGEQLRPIGLGEFIQEVMLGVRCGEQVVIKLADSDSRKLLPVQAAAQSIRNLVQNAIDASLPGQSVSIAAQVASCGQWQIDVVDKGHGMPAEVLQRLGQPFFTTKQPGKGMGLGVYLSRNVITRLGGTLEFVSEPNQGTQAKITLA
jgi:two-component system sensor histidine kinase RegB